MKELQNKQQFKKSLFSFPVLVVVLVLAIFLVRGAISIMSKSYESGETLEDLEKESLTLSQRQSDLKTGIEKLQTPDGLEEEVRSKFNVVLPGEQVAIIVDEKMEADEALNESEPWYKRLWGLFK